MKILFLFLIISVTPVLSWAASQRTENSLVPVSQLAVSMANAQMHLSFVVPAGGSCHTYRAGLIKTQSGALLRIRDSVLEHCTRPEVRNFQVEVDAKAPVALAAKAIRLMNPLYIVGQPLASDEDTDEFPRDFTTEL
jgi:hypothetical protein